MHNQIFITILERDLKKLKEEINAYEDEALLWRVEKGITNSPGNLCLHLTGSLNHFIGAVLGNTGYVRNREAEFSLKDIPRKELIDGVDNLIKVVNNTLSKLSDEELDKTFPIPTPIGEVPTIFFLVQITGHLDYHLGQINYHRRLLA
jgi:hypothetical protein